MADFASMIYGTAQNAAQDVGAGMPQAIQQGAGLAIQKQHLDLQQQQMDQQKAQIANAKIEKLYNFLGEAKNYTNAADRKNYLEMGISMRNTLGIDPNAIPDERIRALGSNENAGRMYTLNSMVEAGTMPAKDALRLATDPALADKFAQVNPTPPEMMSKPADLSEALKGYLTRQEQEKKMASEEKIAAMKNAASGGKTVDAAVDKISSEARTKLAPLQKKQVELTDALDARDRVLVALQKDPSGRTVAPQDMGGMVYAFLHTELGRVNAIELAHQFNMPGIENMSQDALVKAFGGANPNAIRNIVKRVDSAAKNADAAIANEAKSFTNQVNSKGKFSDDQKKAVLDTIAPLVQPVSRPHPGATAKPISFAGHDWTPDQLKAAIAQGAASTDPVVKRKAAAAQQALTAAGVQ